jgi:membrane fusion protein (multidrug efflux system)
MHKRTIVKIVTLIGLLGLAFCFFYPKSAFEETDNAYVKADIATVSTEVSGKIQHIIAEENLSIKKGDVIAVIDDFHLVQGVERATLDLKISEDALAITTHKIDIENLQSSNESEIAKKAISMLEKQKEIDSTRVKEAKIALKIAEIALSNSKITSPIDGVITKKLISMGSMVQTGMPIAYIVPHHLYITANFKETQIVNIKPGQKVSIRIDALYSNGFDDFKGTVKSIAPASGATFSFIPLDNATGNFTKVVQRIPVIIEFDSDQSGIEKVTVGMSSKVSIKTKD